MKPTPHHNTQHYIRPTNKQHYTPPQHNATYANTTYRFPLSCLLSVCVAELSGVPYTDHALLTANNHLDWTAPKLYVYAILNISVSLAFYGLMKFYYATSAQLAWCDPW